MQSEEKKQAPEYRVLSCEDSNRKLQSSLLVVEVALPRIGIKIQMCALFLSDYIIIMSFFPSFSFPFLVGAIVICCVVGVMTQMIEL